jgi:ABC-type Fe3+ transport system permease subunit
VSTDLRTRPTTDGVERARRVTKAVVVCLAGLAVAIWGAFLPLWQVNNSFDRRFPEVPVTWWGVIDPDPHDGVLITSIMVAGVAALVAVCVALFTLTNERRRPWFGPMVGTTAVVWLLELAAWRFVYDDHASLVTPHIGFYLMGFGLLVCVGAAIVDATPNFLGLDR